MSLDKRVTWNEHGDPILTITAAGHSDVYRLACHLKRGQCEFADLGRRIQDALRKRWGSEKYKALESHYWGPQGER
jgi:hypothetical protein